MIAVLLAVLFAAAASPAPAASPCAGADPAVADMSMKLVKKHGGDDHYIITAGITNRGERAQEPGIVQHVALVRDGKMLAPQVVPALGPGVRYVVAFAIDRPSSQRKEPLEVMVRYTLDKGDEALNNCNHTGDSLTKVF
jgi:hypothetical protein